jgi:hypothetical protein
LGKPHGLPLLGVCRQQQTVSNATLVYSRYRSDISLSYENKASYSSKNPETQEEESGNTYQFLNRYTGPVSKIWGIGSILIMHTTIIHLIRFGTALLQHNFRPEESRIFQIERKWGKKQERHHHVCRRSGQGAGTILVCRG